MPPPTHQTFETNSFVVCSFVPRLYDYHPLGIPAPYNHSNVDSDEVIYYVDGDFMSRKHVERGMITLHPIGIPHGPHPGTVEKSIGKKETNELAVMIDPFNPVMITTEALKIEIGDYYKSWITKTENKIHISFDVSALDPYFFNSTSNTASGGLNVYDIVSIINKSIETKKLIGLDIVEFNPNIGNLNKSVEVLKNIFEIILKPNFYLFYNFIWINIWII